MSELLDTVKSIAMTDPAMPRLVKRITANFDDFKEVGARNQACAPLLVMEGVSHVECCPTSTTSTINFR